MFSGWKQDMPCLEAGNHWSKMIKSHSVQAEWLLIPFKLLDNVLVGFGVKTGVLLYSFG